MAHGMVVVKAPAAICRKVIAAIDIGKKDISIWGDGHQTRSFQYIDDCVKGIDLIMHCDDLIATPINLGSSELVSINELLSKVENIAGVKLKRSYDLTAPRGVAGPQQRQHIHQTSPRLGTKHGFGQRTCGDIQMDPRAVLQTQRRQTSCGIITIKNRSVKT